MMLLMAALATAMIVMAGGYDDGYNAGGDNEGGYGEADGVAEREREADKQLE